MSAGPRGCDGIPERPSFKYFKYSVTTAILGACLRFVDRTCGVR